MELSKSMSNELLPAPTIEAQDFDNDQALHHLCSQAGLNDIAIRADEVTFYFEDETEWWANQWSYGRRALLERMSDEVQMRYKQAALGIVRRSQSASGIPMSIKALFTRAIKPS